MPKKFTNIITTLNKSIKTNIDNAINELVEKGMDKKDAVLYINLMLFGVRAK